jgi:hypothetical protein
MAKSEPKNEQILCDTVAKLLAQEKGESVLRKESVDANVRDRKAVEAIYYTKSRKFALEHYVM